MNKMLIGSAVGLAMGIGLMMLPGIRQDVQKLSLIHISEPTRPY